MDTFYWSTDFPHANNYETMSQYLDCHLPSDFEVISQDGTVAEIVNSVGDRYEVHASGDGDSFNHKVTFVFLGSSRT